MPRLARHNLDRATQRNALTVRDNIRNGIYAGRPQWPPNKPLTIKLKGSSRPLVNHGDLAKAADVKAILPSLYFIGWKRGVKNRDGIEVVNIARIHEYGKTILPKKAKMLAIPATRQAALAARSVTSLRQIEGLFIPRGTRVLAKKDAGGDGFEIWFILVHKVVIPARPSISPAIRQSKRRCNRRWENSLRATIEGRIYGG